MIGINLATGLKRHFASEKWERISSKLWKQAREKAHNAIKKDVSLNIKGYDINKNAIKLSKYNARKAGVEKYITFENIPLKDLKTDDKYGVIICNPGYPNCTKVHSLDSWGICSPPFQRVPIPSRRYLGKP
ncbi:Putative RNA methylase family UPF0020 [Thermoanaerobacter thermohydrosulfuricus]|nr:Putative RNA methylase family UPF0020 [Thermoanaerobacter thermohydrosulfuricus]